MQHAFPNARLAGQRLLFRFRRGRALLVGASLLGLAVVMLAWRQIDLEQTLARQYGEATASANRRDWDRAVAGFETVVRLRSDYRDASARLEVARRELRLRDEYDAALLRFREADWEAATRQLEVLAAEMPADQDVAARLVEAKHQLGWQRQYDQARAHLAARDFEAALGGLAAVAASDYSGAVTAAGELAQAKRDYAADLVRQATAAQQARRTLEVERLARLAIEQDPRAASAHRLRGGALDDLHRYAEARAALTVATSLNPRDAEAFNLLGWANLHGRGGDLGAAEQAFRQAFALDPKLANAVTGLGQLQLRRRQVDEARATFQQAIGLNDNEAAAYQGLGLLALSARDYHGAEGYFHEAVKRESDEPVFHLNLATSLLRQQHPEAARLELDQARELAPDDPEVDAAFARYYREIKQYAESLAAFDTAIARQADEPDYHFGRGITLLLMERYPDAVAEATRTLDLGDLADGQVLRAYTYSYQGFYAEARAAARQALEADPANGLAQGLLKDLAGR